MAATSGALFIAPTSGNVASYRGKSVALDVHFAVWDNNLPLLRDLLVSQCYDLETRDNNGYTPYLLALSLGRTTAATMLLAGGAYAKARLPVDRMRGLNGLSWECFHLAAFTGNPHLVRSTVMGMLRETDVAFQRRAPALAAGFAGMPDFEMTMTWEFSSWIPFVSGMLPRDTMTVRKRGTALRLDSTLLGMSGLTWQRGDVSQVVTATPEGDAVFLLLDNEARTAGDGRESFLVPEDKNVQDWVRKLFVKPQKVSDWWSKDTTFDPQFVKGWLGGDTEEPKTADVGEWTGCTLYAMNGLKQTELTHSALAADLPLADWWRPVYEKAKWSALEGGAAAESVDLTSHSAALVEDRPEAGLAPLTSALATVAGGPADVAAAAEAAAEGRGDGEQGLVGAAAKSKTVALQSFIAQFRGATAGTVLEYDHLNNNYGVPGLDVARGNAAVDAGLVQEVIAGLGVTAVKGEGLPPVKAEAGAASPAAPPAAPGAAPTPPATAPPACPAGEAARSGDHIASNAMGQALEGNVSSSDKVMDCTVAFHPGFPLTREQMLPIAQALARTGAHFQNFRKFFEHKMPAEAGFPVQFSIPVLPTVKATITFGACALTTPPAELFTAPQDYAMGEYEEKGFIRQL